MARPVIAVAPAALCIAALTACGAAQPPNPRLGARVVHVVAGENFWGDIAAQIGGAHAAVTSIISDPGAEPDLYASSPRDAARVETANLVIANGAGYDAFVNKLLGASSGKGRTVLTVADVLRARGADVNPHLWYDVPRVPVVAAAIARALSRADPRDAPLFAARLRRFDASLRPLLATLAAIRRRYAGAPVAYTERLPGYLLTAAGLAIKTPRAFVSATEDGNEPSPGAAATMDALMTGHRVRALLYNAQASGPVTENVRALARRAGIPVVAVTETLPPHRSYQAWQLAQARALLRALGGGR